MSKETETSEDFQNRINFTISNILFALSLVCVLLFAYLGGIGLIISIVLMVAFYVLCIRVLKAKPNVVPVIIAGLVFTLSIAYLIVLIIRQIISA